MKNRIMPSSTIQGTKVKNLSNEDIGEIEDLMIDPETGRVAYAVLSFGGFLGIGDKHFAIPMEALKFSSREQEIVLDIDKEKLKNAPGFSFSRENWPRDVSPDFIDSMYQHYGYTPYRDRAGIS